MQRLLPCSESACPRRTRLQSVWRHLRLEHHLEAYRSFPHGKFALQVAHICCTFEIVPFEAGYASKARGYKAWTCASATCPGARTATVSMTHRTCAGSANHVPIELHQRLDYTLRWKEAFCSFPVRFSQVGVRRLQPSVRGELRAQALSGSPSRRNRVATTLGPEKRRQ
jgi:hypothetical protein